MKVSCNIIEDLLPLYTDDVCSAESRKLVNEHLTDCPKCLEKLKAMQDDTVVRVHIRTLKNLGGWLEKFRLKTLIKGIVCGALIIALIAGGYLFLTQATIMKVPAKKVTVSDVCMLSDGNIAFHMYIDDKYDLNAISADIDDDGNMYITPERAMIENRRIRDFNMGLFNMYYGVEIHEFDPETGRDTNPYLDFFFTAGVEPKAVYLRLRSEDILIWKQGMELPAASEKLEEQFIHPDLNIDGNG